MNYSTTNNSLNILNLTTTGTKVIVGEPNSKITMKKSHNGRIRGVGMIYSSRPTTDDYYIYGLNLEVIVISPTATTEYQSAYGLENCINIINSTITAHAGQGENFSIRSYSAYPFYICKSIVNCTAISNLDDTFVALQPFHTCTNIIDCKAITPNITDKIDSVYGFYNSKEVIYCQAYNNIFYNSFSSSNTNSTYACANTLEGGWNTTNVISQE